MFNEQEKGTSLTERGLTAIHRLLQGPEVQKSQCFQTTKVFVKIFVASRLRGLTCKV